MVKAWQTVGIPSVAIHNHMGKTVIAYQPGNESMLALLLYAAADEMVAKARAPQGLH